MSDIITDAGTDFYDLGIESAVHAMCVLGLFGQKLGNILLKSDGFLNLADEYSRRKFRELVETLEDKLREETENADTD